MPTRTALVENGTHALFGVASAGFALWQAASATGAHLLWRVTKNRHLPVVKRLPDGSYLSQIEPAVATKKIIKGSVLPITVRVIGYELPGALEPELKPAALYRLITTLLDHQDTNVRLAKPTKCTDDVEME